MYKVKVGQLNLSFEKIVGPQKHKRICKGAFKNYVDRKGWIGNQSNFYANKENELFLY